MAILSNESLKGIYGSKKKWVQYQQPGIYWIIISLDACIWTKNPLLETYFHQEVCRQPQSHHLSVQISILSSVKEFYILKAFYLLKILWLG